MRSYILLIAISLTAAGLAACPPQDCGQPAPGEHLTGCDPNDCQRSGNDNITHLEDPCRLASNDSIWHDGKDHCYGRETQNVGCNQADECPGRCGPGCGRTGGGVYALDCAEHDRCCRVHGGCVNPLDQSCGDEWREAADDFIFGSRDCRGGCM